MSVCREKGIIRKLSVSPFSSSQSPFHSLLYYHTLSAHSHYSLMIDPHIALQEFFPELDLPGPSVRRSQSPPVTSAPSTSAPPPNVSPEAFPPARIPTRPQRPCTKKRKVLFDTENFSEKDLFNCSTLFITRCDDDVQISCMVSIRPSVSSFSEVVPVAVRAAQVKLQSKLNQLFPNRRTRLLCARVDHPQLTANHKLFVHLRPSTDLGKIVLQQVERCLNSDRTVNFTDSFRIVLLAHFEK